MLHAQVVRPEVWAPERCESGEVADEQAQDWEGERNAPSDETGGWNNDWEAHGDRAIAGLAVLP